MRDTEDIPGEHDAEFRRELGTFLTTADEATTWRLERVLKQSDFETTELVSGEPDHGPAGLYVRKRIDAGSGAGAAYLALWEAQREGTCPACVTRLVECVRHGDELTVVMAYVEGGTVSTLVTSLGAGTDAALRVMVPLCSAVAELHECFDPPLIHRDLKPSNVLMRNGAPTIIDFGVARQWREGAETDTAHFLTRCYAPPEQFGFGQTDERSDVYALGKMLFFCLVGENPPNVCDAAACEAYGLPAAVTEVICRACAFDPGARYVGARELGRAIEDALKPSAPVLEPSAPHAQETNAAEPGEPHTYGQEIRRGAKTIISSCQTFLDRIPHWVGRMWNAALLTIYVLFALLCIIAIAVPNEHDSTLPLWFRITEYVGLGVVSMGGICFALLDRRRLAKRIPVLASLGHFKTLAMCGLVALIGFLVPLISGMAAGLI